MAARQHPSEGLYGLRLIQNNVTSDGSGRDFVIFNNPGFTGGRRTPGMKDKTLGMQGQRPPLTPHVRGRGAAWSLPGDGRKAGFGKSAATTGKPGAGTVARWKRVASEPTYLDQLGKTKPPSPRDIQLPRKPNVEVSFHEDADFKPQNRKVNLKMETFPVEKYQYFSHPELLDRKAPQEDHGRATLGRLEVEGRFGAKPSVGKPTADKYHWFSDDHVRRSPNFQSEDAHTGLAARATLGGPGLMRASLAALPRMPANLVYPFGLM